MGALLARVGNAVVSCFRTTPNREPQLIPRTTQPFANLTAQPYSCRPWVQSSAAYIKKNAGQGRTHIVRGLYGIV